MILTDRLVFIHVPKNAGTFVSAVLQTIHDNRLNRLINSRFRYKWLSCRFRHDRLYRRVAAELPLPDYHLFVEYFTADTKLGSRLPYSLHNGCRHIPATFRNLPILGVVRDPLDRYVSFYEFDWCQKHPVSPTGSRCRDMAAEEMSFRSFVEFINGEYLSYLLRGIDSADVGYQTVEFVDLFCREPEYVLENLDDTSDPIDLLQSNLDEATFLHKENLDNELYDALVEFGFDEHELRTIDRTEPKNVSDREHATWHEYFDDDLRAMARDRERLLFELFPEYDTQV